jgi:hypothetical protein
MYLGKKTAIKTPDIDNKVIAQCIERVNSDMQKFSRLSKTTISTLIGELLVNELIDTGVCQRHASEKGHPDILPNNIANNINYFDDVGFDIKVSCKNSFSSHHNQSKKILGVFWSVNTDEQVEILGCVFYNLNHDCWNQPNIVDGTRNTNCCTIKPQHIYIGDIICFSDNLELCLEHTAFNKILRHNLQINNVIIRDEYENSRT